MKSSLRSTRLRMPISILQPFVCKRCSLLPGQLAALRRQRPFSSIAPRKAAAAPPPPENGDEGEGKKSNYTDVLRRRIWGTDTPPGQKDPYQRLSAEELEKERLERLATEASATPSSDTADEISRRESSGEYVPAQDWDGLERIGGAKGWWEERFDRENVYTGFLTDAAGVGGDLLSPAERANIPGLVRRVAVEILALQAAGVQKLDIGAKAEVMDEEFMEEIDVVRRSDGAWELREHSPDIIDELVETLQTIPEPESELAEIQTEETEELDEAMVEEEDTISADNEQRLLDELHAEEEEEEAAAAATAAEATQGETETTAQPELETVGTSKLHDPIYLTLPLTDLAFKFAITKRLTYLLGSRIPDPAIASFSTLADIVHHLSAAPKPKKLAHILAGMPELVGLANVEIRAEKRGFVHREMEVGRWKVIEAELRRKGLPVRKSDRLLR